MKTSPKILELLEEDGSLSTKELASMVGCNVKTVEADLAKLKKKGVVKKIKAVVDWRKAGVKKAQAIIQVKVTPQVKAGFARICKDIAKDKRVQDVFVVSGEYDLIVFVRGESLDEVSDFVTEKLAPKKEVLGTNTNIILREFKRDGAILEGDDQKRLAVSI